MTKVITPDEHQQIAIYTEIYQHNGKPMWAHIGRLLNMPPTTIETIHTKRPEVLAKAREGLDMEAITRDHTEAITNQIRSGSNALAGQGQARALELMADPDSKPREWKDAALATSILTDKQADVHGRPSRYSAAHQKIEHTGNVSVTIQLAGRPTEELIESCKADQLPGRTEIANVKGDKAV